MTHYLKILFYSSFCMFMAGCTPKHSKGTFGYDLNFLKEHHAVITLEENKGKSQVILVPEFQGRVMTSAAKGLEGNSYGWINYDLIASKMLEEHI